MNSSDGENTRILRFAQFLTYCVYAFVTIALVILVLGFFLILFGANPEAPFAAWVYRGLHRVMAPFRGIFETVPVKDGRSYVDFSVLFAMIVYGIVALALHNLIDWLKDRLVESEARDAARQTPALGGRSRGETHTEPTTRVG